MPGEHEAIPDSENPSFDCIVGSHMMIDVYDVDPGAAVNPRETIGCVASWCLWCGTGMSDPAKIDDALRPIGFNPHFRLYVPAGWIREPVGAA